MSQPLNPGMAKVALVREYYNELLSFLTLRLGSRDQATDVVQETFLRVFSQQSSRPILNPRAFLYRTATNITIDLFRRQQRQSPRFVDLEEAQACPSGYPDQERILAGKEQLRRLSQAIIDLPPRCRQVFMLYKLKGKSQKEIADRLGISRNMVEKHIMNAMDHCRRRLEESPSSVSSGDCG